MKLLLLLLAFLAALQSPAGVARIEGTDAASGITYVLISSEGHIVGTTPASPAAAPRLTAQCTKTPGGKLHFEMLADFGGVEPISYIAPWSPKTGQTYAPEVDTSQVTMEFLGYTKVKPVKRQWNAIPEIPGEWKYATPGISSRNMEQVMFYLQYLRALPTLRLTLPGKPSVEFDTTRWQAAVKAEPLCAASGL